MSDIVAVAHTLAQTLEKLGVVLDRRFYGEFYVLQKLRWFRKGGGISDRQWGDLLSVLKVQANTLDHDYLRHWAAEIGVDDLLLRAFGAAGIIPTSAK